MEIPLGNRKHPLTTPFVADSEQLIQKCLETNTTARIHQKKNLSSHEQTCWLAWTVFCHQKKQHVYKPHSNGAMCFQTAKLGNNQNAWENCHCNCSIWFKQCVHGAGHISLGRTCILSWHGKRNDACLSDWRPEHFCKRQSDTKGPKFSSAVSPAWSLRRGGNQWLTSSVPPLSEVHQGVTRTIASTT